MPFASGVPVPSSVPASRRNVLSFTSPVPSFTRSGFASRPSFTPASASGSTACSIRYTSTVFFARPTSVRGSKATWTGSPTLKERVTWKWGNSAMGLPASSRRVGSAAPWAPGMVPRRRSRERERAGAGLRMLSVGSRPGWRRAVTEDSRGAPDRSRAVLGPRRDWPAAREAPRLALEHAHEPDRLVDRRARPLPARDDREGVPDLAVVTRALLERERATRAVSREHERVLAAERVLGRGLLEDHREAHREREAARVVPAALRHDVRGPRRIAVERRDVVERARAHERRGRTEAVAHDVGVVHVQVEERAAAPRPVP